MSRDPLDQNADLAAAHRRIAELEAQNAQLRAALPFESVFSFSPTTLWADIFENVPALIVLFAGPNHRFVFANAQTRATFNNRPLVGLPVREALPDLAGQGFFELLDRVYLTGEPFLGKALPARIARDGHFDEGFFTFFYEPVRDAAGAVVGIFEIGFDVTETIQAQQQAAQSEGRLAQIVETVGEGIGIIDPSGKLVFANSAAERILHLERSAITTRTYDDPKWHNLSVAGEPLPPEEHPMAIMLRTGQPVFESEVAVDIPDHERIFISINAAPLTAPDGTLTGGIGSFRDVTERHRLEAQRDMFMAMVVHDLRAPLTAIKGLVQLAERRFARAGRTEDAQQMHKINNQANRLAALLDDLADLDQIQTGHFRLKMAAFDWAEGVRQACAGLEPTTQNHVLLVETPPQLEIVGDAGRLGQVVTNLVGNAIKYSPGGGTIGVRLVAHSGEALLTIHDQGIGIPPQDRSYIFEPFARATNAGQGGISGKGLGLYICQQIVTGHGGRIGLADPQGEPGTTFYVALPLPLHPDFTAT